MQKKQTKSTRKNTKFEMPDENKMQELKEEFEKDIVEQVQDEKQGYISPKKQFLISIKNEIETAVKMGISIRGLQKIIQKRFGVEISIPIIRNFIKDEKNGGEVESQKTDTKVEEKEVIEIASEIEKEEKKKAYLE